MKRISDRIADWLVERGVEQVFQLPAAVLCF